MATFGRYNTIEVVALTPHGPVYTAKLAGGAPEARFVVKQFKAPVTDSDEPNWECQSFLDRARVQRSVLASGGKYWAPVHDMGVNEEGSWIAGDYHPLSAQKLIDGQVKLRGPALHRIIDSVARGLYELREARHRAHGSLKPSNVLIESRGDLAESRVMLTDPAQGVIESEAGDLFSLGQLIHELVLHRPFRQGDAWPIPRSSEWSKLGRRGERWRQLCNELLSPAEDERPDVRSVLKLLRGMGPRRVPVKRLAATAIAACILLAVGASFAVRASVARQEFCKAKSAWVAPLAGALADPDRRARYVADPALHGVVSEMDASGIAKVSCDAPSLIMSLTPSELRRIQAANTSVHRIEQSLAPDHWQRLTTLVYLARQYDQRGWQQPAEFLARLVEAAQPRAGAAMAEGIDRVLHVAPLLDRERDAAEVAWNQFEGKMKDLEATQDSDLRGFARSLRQSASESVRLSDEGYVGIDAVKAQVGLASRLADLAHEGWPTNYDAARLAQDTSVDPRNSKVADIRRWLDALPLYATRKTETIAAAVSLQQRLRQTTESINATRPDPAERAALDRDRKLVEAEIARFQQSAFVEKELEDGTFASRRSGLEARIDALRKYSHPQSPVEWLQGLPAIATSSPRVNAFWDAWKNAQLSTLRRAGNDRSLLAAVQARADALRTVLTDLDRAFPKPPTGLSETFTAAARDRREQEINKLLAAVDVQSPRLDVLAAASAGTSYTDWCGNLRELAKDFPIQKELLTPADRPDEKWATQDAFWNDPAIRELVRPDLDRLSRLRQIASQPRSQLVQLATDAKEPEIALEAWRALGRDDLRPAWPATADELKTELALRDRLKSMIERLQDPAERTGPLAMLREQAPRRWEHLADHADSEAVLASAIEHKAQFDVDAAVLRRLPAITRFNLWLYLTRQQVEKGDDAAVAQGLEAGRRIATEMERNDLVDMFDRLIRPGSKEPFADQKPGDLFKVALLGVQPALEFKRVVPQEGRPFYLSTTEVSVAQFANAIEASGAWDQCRKIPWAYEPGGKDVRRGPRAWEWSDGLPARMSPPQMWLAPDEANDFPIEFRTSRFNRSDLREQVGGNPSDQHPMQQLSAQAALWYAGLVGCRLPTPGEWQIAYEKYEKAAPPQQWNLRDRTWDVDRRYVLANQGGGAAVQLPDEGIFRGEDRVGGHDTTSRPGDDGTLFFRPVSASGGSVFHHLVGNVAEYVCDDARRFEQWPDKRATGIRAFIESTPRSLHVIGGSALSPPEMPVDRPMSVLHPDRGYADVGFRLAFTAPARTLSERVKYALANQGYLWQPQKPAPATQPAENQ